MHTCVDSLKQFSNSDRTTTFLEHVVQSSYRGFNRYGEGPPWTCSVVSRDCLDGFPFDCEHAFFLRPLVGSELPLFALGDST